MPSFIKKLFGSKAERDFREIKPLLDQTLQAYESIKNLDNDQLRAKTQEFRQRIRENVMGEQEQINQLRKQIEENFAMDVEEKERLYNQIDGLEKTQDEKTEELLQQILPEAFSVIKETARRFKENNEVKVTATQMDRDLAAFRPSININGNTAVYQNQWVAGGNTITWDMVHYDVQLIGGIHLHKGKIAEMATGEGKTLVATLPVYLNALPGKGVHIVTVNDYLAKRDSEWMGMLFEFHGLKVDCVDKHEPNSTERRKAYLADITYGTNNEFGFDYLRDNMARNPEELVQRKHNYAIVDEVDSVLIDDARTPLIISGPTPQGDKHEFHELKPKIERLYSAQRSLVTSMLADARKLLTGKEGETDEKKGGELLLRCHRGLPKNKALIKFLSEPGMKTILQKTENFYMQEQSKHMHIIDDELYFVIEEKNNSIELTEKGIDLITSQTDDPHFFILPDMGSEIAEIEKSNLSHQERLEKKNELLSDFSVKSERVHTVNQLLKAYTLFEKDTEYVIIDNKVKIVDEQTGRIMEGRRYSDGLHQAIEAKENVKVEAATQTYATITLQNYFRMYRKLAGMTGTAETEAGEFWDIYKLDVVVVPTHRPVVRNDREDLVYKTKREKYNAVIDEVNDLVNAGRPVLVGTTSVEISEVLSRMLNLRKIRHNILNAKQHQKEAQIVAEAGQAGTVTIATNMAGRGTDIKLGHGVKEAGGLAIIGTERHESRRVDRQLRGRAGRQGDPGSSQFFVSLEDDLMRVFGSERISKIMDRMGLQEGEVIQHSMITKSIERAQKKVEENNFGIRKRLLEYDDVMNAQREVIYRKRRNALFGERLAVDIANMMYDTCEQMIIEGQDQGDPEGFEMNLLKTFGMESPFAERELLDEKTDKLTDALYAKAVQNYKTKNESIAASAFPVIKDVYEKASELYENIAIPITDGIKNINIVTNLKKAYETNGREVALSIEKSITLAIIDNAWKEHLREMDDLKQSVQGAAYEQKDPLLIYKFESFELFKRMLNKVNRDIIAFLVKARLPIQNADQVKRAAAPERTDMSRMQTGRSDVPGGGQRKAEPVRVEKKVGRNEPC
ncbi:MAG: preprotein translocase subunit SecA, partial [Bacteroides sp.]|nr:preprotein translocase subunit SecA [Bacteroides sp.]